MFSTKADTTYDCDIRHDLHTFQLSITNVANRKDIEPNVANKKDIIESVKRISKIIGKDNIFIRYDPIFLSDKYNLEYHKRAFLKLCKLLNGYVNKIIVSFIDDYKNVRNNKKSEVLKAGSGIYFGTGRKNL